MPLEGEPSVIEGLRLLEQRLTLRGEYREAGGPVEQLRVQRDLEVRDGRAHRGLASTHRPGGPGEGTVPGGEDEDLDLFQSGSHSSAVRPPAALRSA